MGASCCEAAAGGVFVSIPDPDAVRPPGWDDEDDGVWLPPMIEVAIADLRGLPALRGKLRRSREIVRLGFWLGLF